jgi:hypothetical protein
LRNNAGNHNSADNDDNENIDTTNWTKKRSSSSASSSTSSANLHADVEGIRSMIGLPLLPSSSSSGQLKAAAMQRIAASSDVKFSRLAGIQPFKNATALFVNVGGENYYENVFDRLAVRLRGREIDSLVLFFVPFRDLHLTIGWSNRNVVVRTATTTQKLACDCEM